MSKADVPIDEITMDPRMVSAFAARIAQNAYDVAPYKLSKLDQDFMRSEGDDLINVVEELMKIIVERRHGDSQKQALSWLSRALACTFTIGVHTTEKEMRRTFTTRARAKLELNRESPKKRP